MLELKGYSRLKFKTNMSSLWSVIQLKKKPTRLDGAEWVTYAWGQIRADSITNTWPSIDVNLESQQYKYNCIK